MKRFFAIFFIILVMFMPLCAFEWGGLLTEDFRFSSTDFKPENNSFKQGNSASLWITVPFSANGNFYFSGQGSIKYNLDLKSTESFNLIYDIDLLKLSGKTDIGSAAISLAMGRYSVSDLTGKIFNQNADGLSLKVTSQIVEFSAYAGYTGLINALNVSMINSPTAVYEYKNNYSPAYKYVPVSFSVEAPSLFANHTFNSQVSAFFDAEKAFADDAYNRYYATVSMMGPILGTLYYSVMTSFGSVNFKDVSNYSALSLQMFVNNNLTLKANAEYASGNHMGLSPFVGFTSSPAYMSVNYPELSGVLMPSLDLVFTTNNFYTGINGKLVLSCPESNFNMQGINVGANVIYNLFSDLQLGVSGNYYRDMYSNGLEDNMSLGLNLSLSF